MSAQLEQLLGYLERDGVSELVITVGRPITMRTVAGYSNVTARPVTGDQMISLVRGTPLAPMIPSTDVTHDAVDVQIGARRIRARVARRGDEIVVRLERAAPVATQPMARIATPGPLATPMGRGASSGDAATPAVATQPMARVAVPLDGSRVSFRPATPRIETPTPPRSEPATQPRTKSPTRGAKAPTQGRAKTPTQGRAKTPTHTRTKTPTQTRTKAATKGATNAPRTKTQSRASSLKPTAPSAVATPLAAPLTDEQSKGDLSITGLDLDAPFDGELELGPPLHTLPASTPFTGGGAIDLDSGPAGTFGIDAPGGAFGIDAPAVFSLEPAFAVDAPSGHAASLASHVQAASRASASAAIAPAIAPSPSPARAPANFAGQVQAVSRAIAGPRDLGGFASIMRKARERGASDLHVAAARVTSIRITSELVPIDASATALSASEAEAILLPLLDPAQAAQLAETGYVDLALEAPDGGRLRTNISRVQGGLKGTFRLALAKPASLEELGLPADLAKVVAHHQGLVVVAGPSGHGKTTTLAAFVDLLNSTRPYHILTIEDPVEIVHQRKQAVISQREAGRHTVSFARGLKASLREDPDVIVIGELRDRESVEIALTAAETGHLVIATMSTPSAAKTIDRLIDMFPPEDHSQVRASIAGALRAIVAQRLLPKLGGGIIPAIELVTGVLPLAVLIRDDKLYQLPNLMQRGRAFGMIRFDESLAELVRTGKISEEVALAAADSKKDLAVVLRPPAPEPVKTSPLWRFGKKEDR